MAFHGIHGSTAILLFGLVFSAFGTACRDDNTVGSPWAAGGVGTFHKSAETGGQGAAGPSDPGGMVDEGCLGASDCDDGNACTLDSCEDGQCFYWSLELDDDNACTEDVCDPSLGVLHAAIDPSDNNACTVDSCDPQNGILHTSLDPDDKNPCTVDFCDPAMGVFHTLVNPDDGDPCTADSCDPATGVSHTPISCDDNNPCTADSCDPQKGCVHTPVSFFNESFQGNAAGWTLGVGWEIGKAKASSGQSDATPPFGADPADDHSSTSDGGVAGVHLGGNIPLNPNHSYRYLTSPPIDLSSIAGPVWLDFHHVLNSDYPPYMDASVEVFDGVRWETLYAVPFSGPPIKESSWTRSVYDVTQYKNDKFRIRFGYAVFNGDGAYVVGGWNIDDLRLVPGESCAQ